MSHKTKNDIIAYIAVFTMIFNVCIPYINATNDTFTQADWSSGASVNVPNNTTNQTGWNEYGTSDANITTSTDLQLNNIEQTAHINFNTEADYAQEDAVNGTDFIAGKVSLRGSGFSATGGNISTVGSDTVHTFTSSGTFSVQGAGGDVRVLVVGAGGAAGGAVSGVRWNGGGGGGAVIEDMTYSTSGDITVTVGAGGVRLGNSGGSSQFGTIIANGGGGGYVTGNGGYSGNGNRGHTTSSFYGGGGGGAGGTGAWQSGGAGIYSDISGTNYSYGNGGYGGAESSIVHGAANSGHGGRGGGGGNGGSGVVIVRYSGTLTYPTTPYYTTTNTNSQINTSTWGAINSVDTTQTTPANTNITYLVSFDNKNTWKYYNGSSWQDSTLTNIDTNGMDKTTLENLTVNEWSQVFTEGTIDFAANLSSTDNTVTPELDNIQINYTTPQTQTLTSNTFDTEDTVNAIESLTWSETLASNTDVQLQIRTSPDNSTWTDWCGPDNNTIDTCDTNTYFTDPTGNETIDDIHSDGANDRYIQYKAYLETTDGQNTPILDDITFTYTSLTEITVEDPDTTKVGNIVTKSYVSTTGTATNTTDATTNLELKLQRNNHHATFPQNTIITERSNQNFNFQNFTLEEVDVQSEQRDSRGAVRIGIPGEKLDFSEDITLTIFVGHAYNDLTMDVLYQEEGESTWNTHTTCTITNGNCTFTTDHATIYTINGVLQSTGDAPININTEVKDTLTLDCYDTAGSTGDYDVSIGTATDPGKVTAGTPATGQSTCIVTTNDDQGYYLTIIDDNAVASAVLTHDDPNTATTYEISDLTQFPTTQNWSAPTTKGLGFSVINFPDTNLTNNTLDGIWTETGTCPEGAAADTNDYAGVPDTQQTIAAVTQYEANQTTTNICYKVDVPASQASGQYEGSVTYTATSDASSYLN